MKNIKYFALFLFVTLFPLVSFADVPPGPDYHYVEFCAKIVNQNDFPDVVVVANWYGAMNDGSKGVLVKNNECIGGYKYSDVDIYWVTKNDFNIEDLDNFKDLKTKKYTGYLTKKLEHYMGYVKNTDPLVKQTVEYVITKNSGGKMSLYKSRIISDYNNGTPQKIEIFRTPSSTKTADLKNDVKKPTFDEINQVVTNDQAINVQPAPKKSFVRSLLCRIGFVKLCN